MKRDIWSKYCERVVYLVNFTSSVSSFLSHPPKHGQSSSSCKPKLMFLEVPCSRWSLKRFLRNARGQMWYLKIHHVSGSLASPSLKSAHSESFILFSHFPPGICYSYYYLHFLWRMSQLLKALSSGRHGIQRGRFRELCKGEISHSNIGLDSQTFLYLYEHILFFPLSENYFYSHTSNNFLYVQLSKEEIFIIIAYQEPR